MQVKCTSCGASQEISTEQKCSFCGSIINPNNLQSANFTAIHKNSKGDKIILYEKSLEHISSEGTYLILFKNIIGLKTSIHELISPLPHKILFTIGVFICACLIYTFLIPHAITHTGNVYGSKVSYDETSDVSVGGFIFSFGILASPFIIGGYLRYWRYKLIKRASNSDQSIFLEIKDVSSKRLIIGDRLATEKICNLLKERIEYIKMRQE